MAISHLGGDNVGDVIDRNLGQTFQAEDCIDKENNRLVSIPEKAAELLLLNDEQREWLFSGYREIKQVLWALDKIVETGSFSVREADRQFDDNACDCSVCRDY